MQLFYFAPANCFFSRKIEAAASISGVSLTRKETSELDTSSIALSRYPSLQAPGGIVSGSNASVRYIANAYPLAELYGRSLTERAQIDGMLDAVTADLETPVLAKVLGAPTSKVAEDLHKGFAALDTLLKKQTYLVGERMSIADLAAAGSIAGCLEKDIFKMEDFAAYVHLSRLFNTVAGRCSWDMQFAAGGEKKPKEAAVAEKPKEAAVAEKSKQAAATQKPKQAAAAEKPKQAAAAEKPKQKGDDEEEEATAAAAPPAKVRDPIEDLAPTSFDMEAWKRYYSNSKDLKGDAMKYLWEKYDKDGWSFWRFKYIRFSDTDNVKVFMASNLLGMFLQRIDNWLRKYSFAVANVFEADGYFDVEGVLLVRGLEIPQRLAEHDQYESFTWQKLDPTTDKASIENFFCEGDAIEGRKIADCKVYK